MPVGEWEAPRTSWSSPKRKRPSSDEARARGQRSSTPASPKTHTDSAGEAGRIEPVADRQDGGGRPVGLPRSTGEDAADDGCESNRVGACHLATQVEGSRRMSAGSRYGVWISQRRLPSRPVWASEADTRFKTRSRHHRYRRACRVRSEPPDAGPPSRSTHGVFPWFLVPCHRPRKPRDSAWCSCYPCSVRACSKGRASPKAPAHLPPPADSESP